MLHGVRGLGVRGYGVRITRDAYHRGGRWGVVLGKGTECHELSEIDDRDPPTERNVQWGGSGATDITNTILESDAEIM